MGGGVVGGQADLPWGEEQRIHSPQGGKLEPPENDGEGYTPPQYVSPQFTGAGMSRGGWVSKQTWHGEAQRTLPHVGN